MDRNQRFEIMAQARGDLTPLLALAEEVLDASEADLHVVTPPSVGVLMLLHREPVDGQVFNAGEVLVTQAQVELAGQRGYAIRLGREPEATLAAAILDAALEAHHALTPRILDGLHALELAEQERRAASWREVAPTRVAFDEMT